jgi:hypothetical protein
MMDRLRYRFDNFMSRGTIALVAALFASTLCMILTASAILVLAGLGPEGSPTRLGVAEAFWQITMRAIDTGTVAGDTGWSFRLVGFLVTMGGIFITSALIGVLASGLEGRLNELRRGRSRVLERPHHHPGLVAAGLHHYQRARFRQPQPFEKKPVSKSWPGSWTKRLCGDLGRSR